MAVFDAFLIQWRVIACLAREIALKTLDYLPLILRCTFCRHGSMDAGCGSRGKSPVCCGGSIPAAGVKMGEFR